MMADTIAALLKKGADKASIWLTNKTQDEFNIIYKELNLLRTVESQGLSLTVIKDQKQAGTRINQFDAGSVEQAVNDVMAAVETSQPDPAFDISPMQPPQVFSDGPQHMDADKIAMRMNEFIQTMKQDFPCVHFDASLSFTRFQAMYMNSNGVDLAEDINLYSFMTMFTAKIGSKMSSFNYIDFEMANLDTPLLEMNNTRELMRQIAEQTEARVIPENFSGEVILSPIVLGGLLYTLIMQQFSSSGLLTNSSRFPDHIGQQVLDAKLTVANLPTDKRMANKNFVSGDGFPSVTAPIIEQGILRHYPINLFTANKIGKPRTMGPAENFVVEAGDMPLAAMIANVREGILCMRASYGQPNAFGDLSAVLKNSYYIKDGKVQYPINETMMSLNLVDIFNNILAISAETFNSGSMILPYMTVGGVALSRK